MKETKSIHRNICKIAFGPILFFICMMVLPDRVFTNIESKYAIGTVVWMAFWWVSSAVDYAITGLVPIIVNALFQISDMTKVVANYSSETIMLLLGASIIIASWIETGLDRRIAKGLLRFIGSNYRKHLLFWFLLSLALSSVLPNAVVCATITPLVVTMLKYAGETDIRNSKKGSRLILYIAYATGIGGLASPLGGAMNLVTIEYLQQITNEEYMYYSWIIRFLPFVVIAAIITIVFMLRGVDKNDELMLISKKKEDGNLNDKITNAEVCVFLFFAIAVVLAFTRTFYDEMLPGLKPAYVFITCAVACFFISTQNGEKIIKWRKIQGKIEFEMIFIFAGGLAAGTLMKESGAVQQLGDLFSETGWNNRLLLVLFIILFTLIMSDVTSNTATAAVAMPIVISIAEGLGQNPIPYIYIASIGVNLSFMLPTSIRAIPVGYGLNPKYMLSEGWKISIIVTILMTIISYYFLKNWALFLTV